MGPSPGVSHSGLLRAEAPRCSGWIPAMALSARPGRPADGCPGSLHSAALTQALVSGRVPGLSPVGAAGPLGEEDARGMITAPFRWQSRPLLRIRASLTGWCPGARGAALLGLSRCPQPCPLLASAQSCSRLPRACAVVQVPVQEQVFTLDGGPGLWPLARMGGPFSAPSRPGPVSHALRVAASPGWPWLPPPTSVSLSVQAASSAACGAWKSC